MISVVRDRVAILWYSMEESFVQGVDMSLAHKHRLLGIARNVMIYFKSRIQVYIMGGTKSFKSLSVFLIRATLFQVDVAFSVLVIIRRCSCPSPVANPKPAPLIVFCCPFPGLTTHHQCV